MMRIAFHSEIRDGAVADYESTHATIPDDLVATFARIGIHDWTIWRSGRRLFHVVDCDDWDAAIAALGDDPANARWQADIGRFVAGFLDGEGRAGMAPIGEVWSLDRQRTS